MQPVLPDIHLAPSLLQRVDVGIAKWPCEREGYRASQEGRAWVPSLRPEKHLPLDWGGGCLLGSRLGQEGREGLRLRR